MAYNALKALYEQLKVSEKRNFCPRQGIYKVINTFNGNCYGRPAFMAKCHWRTTVADEYQIDFKRTIQLESFIKNATEEQLNLLNSQDLIGREIDVFVVQVGKMGLEVKWEFVEQPKTDLDKLNERLYSGDLGDFNLDQLDNSTMDEDDIDFEPEV